MFPIELIRYILQMNEEWKISFGTCFVNIQKLTQISPIKRLVTHHAVISSVELNINTTKLYRLASRYYYGNDHYDDFLVSIWEHDTNYHFHHTTEHNHSNNRSRWKKVL
jgi:hypothetical protein